MKIASILLAVASIAALPPSNRQQEAIKPSAFVSDPAAGNDLLNPYESVGHWAKLPEGMTWGGAGGVALDRAGHIWVLQRCGGSTCFGATEDPILEFDKSGKLLKSFGAGLFVTPHGLTIDKDDNIWATDFAMKGGKGNVVYKFDQNGKILLTLGTPGKAGDGPDSFRQPVGVAIAPNGDIFVADGHGATPTSNIYVADPDSSGGSNYRVVKFSSQGKFLNAWGTRGSGPGQFDGLHAIAFDRKGRLLVGDRGNNRIQIFDQDGHYLTEWKQFSRPAGIFVDKDNNIYVSDSDSTSQTHPGWLRGIRIGSANDGSVRYFIPDPRADFRTYPGFTGWTSAEGIAVDADGTIYGAEVGPKDLRRFVKKQSVTGQKEPGVRQDSDRHQLPGYR